MGRRNRVAPNRGNPVAASLEGIGAPGRAGNFCAVGYDGGELAAAEFITGPDANPRVNGGLAAGHPCPLYVVLCIVGDVVGG